MSYRSKTFITTQKAAASYGKKLSICLMPNGFSFSEMAENGELLTFGQSEGIHSAIMTHAIADIKEYFAQVGIQPLGYKAMELVILSNEHTWVPDKLYQPASNRSYLRLLGGNSASALTYHADSLASVAVFSGNDTLATAFKVALPGLIVVNQHIKLALSTCVQQSIEHPIMVVHWRPKHLDIAIFRGGKYLFGNAVQSDSDSSALYHIVEAMKTFSIDDPDAELLLCGEVNRQRYAVVSPYFPKVQLYTGQATVSAPEFTGLHTYMYAPILI